MQFSTGFQFAIVFCSLNNFICVNCPEVIHYKGQYGNGLNIFILSVFLSLYHIPNNHALIFISKTSLLIVVIKADV